MTRAHQEMRYPNVTWRIILYDYLFTTEPRHICSTPEYFWRNAYISNGRRFTKSTLRISLLSTFHVSSINYSLACSFPIHTKRSTNAEGPRAHCQSKSCKMLHRPKCSTDCIWKGLQPVSDNSRSFKLTVVAAIWLAIYDFLLVIHCKYISVLHRFRDINTICQQESPLPLTDPRDAVTQRMLNIPYRIMS